MGYFQTAYDLYLPFYSVAISGLPVLLSRLVARSVSLTTEMELNPLFLLPNSFYGFRCNNDRGSCFVQSFSPFFGGADDAKTAVYVIAPCVLFPRLWEFTADILRA